MRSRVKEEIRVVMEISAEGKKGGERPMSR